MAETETVNILLVDDQPGKLLTYQAILQDLGENLLTASSAQEALQHLLKADVAVLLVDVCMPDLDGFELARMVREHPRFQKTAIIFISAVALADMDRVRGYATGAVDYVSVPVVPEILRAKVRVFIELYRKTRQLEQMNRELEDRVGARTAELQAQVAERTDILESIGDAFYALDDAWRFTYANRRALELWGKSADAVLGRRFLEAFPSTDGTEPYQAHVRVMERRNVEHLEAISPVLDRWLTISIYPAARGGLSVYFRDITDRKKAEAALRASEARLAGIVDSAMDAIISIDEQQRIVLFNTAAERMFACIATEAVGQPIGRFIPERSRAAHEAYVRQFGATGVTNRHMGALGTLSAVRDNGVEFPIEASISQVEVAGQHLFTVILRDITERTRDEERLELLAREVDHRAKNMLALVQVILRRTRADSVAEYAKGAQGRVSALARAHELLAESRWAGADLHKLVADELAPYRGARVQVSGPPVQLRPRVAQSLAMVLHELATNAVKYGALSRSGGRVLLEWQIIENTQLTLRWIEQGGPPVSKPTCQGFGSSLIERTIRHQHAGNLHLEWRMQGLVCDITLAIRDADPSAGGFEHARCMA